MASQLPVEVLRALEEKNELATQLLRLQEQLQQEKAARDAQSQLFEKQQSELTSQVAGSMGKLQEMLLAIEKKQEATKQDILQYAQATVTRLPKRAASTRVGAIESDDDANTTPATATKDKARGDAERGSAWHEAQLEKMLQVFLKAQAQQQQEIDALAQENSKLWSKKQQKRRHRHDRQAAAESPVLMHMAALDAQHFGVDNGESLLQEPFAVPSLSTASSVAVRPVERVALQVDKLVQTDEEVEAKESPVVVQHMAVQEVQTVASVAAPTPSSVPLVALKKHEPIGQGDVVARELSLSKPVAVEIDAKLVFIPDPPQKKQNEASSSSQEEAPQAAHMSQDAALQHAAQVVSKVALGFLTRQRLQNPVNWRISLPLAALGNALSENERAGLYRRLPGATRDLVVEVETGMTANELRLQIARALFEKHELSEDADDGNMDTNDSRGVDYHRVLLYHRETREELHGDRQVHAFNNLLEVELVPLCQAAEEHVDSVIAFHSDVTERLKEIRRASLQLAENSADDNKTRVGEPQLRRLVRLQARVRGFLAKRKVEGVKIDRLVESRTLRMREAVAARSRSIAAVSELSRRSLFPDPVVASQYRKVHELLSLAVKNKLKSSSREASSGRMSVDTFEQQSRVLERERAKLPGDVQERIQSLQARLDRMVATEYDADRARVREQQNEAAIKIQSAVHIAIARRRLQILLAKDPTPAPGTSESSESSRQSAEPSPSLLSPLSESSAASEPPASAGGGDSEHIDGLDDAEIGKLADAYEEGGVGREQRSVDASASSSNNSDQRASTRKTELAVVSPTLAANERSSPSIVVGEKKPTVVVAARRSLLPPPLLSPTPTTLATEQQPRASTPIHHQVAEAASGPGRSPRPKLQDKDKEGLVISPFSKTPLLSRRSAPATRRGSGYDNAR